MDFVTGSCLNFKADCYRKYRVDVIFPPPQAWGKMTAKYDVTSFILVCQRDNHNI